MSLTYQHGGEILFDQPGGVVFTRKVRKAIEERDEAIAAQKKTEVANAIEILQNFLEGDKVLKGEVRGLNRAIEVLAYQ
jgi:hypothetical protein